MGCLKIKYFLLSLILVEFSLFSEDSSTKTIINENAATKNITKLSQLAPYLGKRIIIPGLVIYGSFGHETKEFPYFLLYGNEKLRVVLDVNSEFFKKLPENISQQPAVISGILNYFLIDLTLSKNVKFKQELVNGDICWPTPSKYGEMELRNVELIQIVEKPFDKIKIKEVPLTAKDKKIKDTRFAVDGNIEKFNEYIQYLIENSN